MTEPTSRLPFQKRAEAATTKFATATSLASAIAQKKIEESNMSKDTKRGLGNACRTVERAAIGAKIGTMIAPGLGTSIGAVVGLFYSAITDGWIDN